MGILMAVKFTPGHRESRFSLGRMTSANFFKLLIRKNTGCVKRVHVFGSYDVMRHIPEISKYMDLFRKSELPLNETDVDCMSEGHDCDIILTMGAEDEMLKGKDAVVFGLAAPQFRGEDGNAQLRKLVTRMPERGQTWIYYSTETPLRVLRWTADLNIGRLKYHVLMTYDRDSDIVLPFGYYKPFASDKNSTQSTTTPPNPVATDPLDKTAGLISWMASNCRGFWPRIKLVERLKELLPLDDYGLCGQKECLPKRSEKCNELMALYKFFLAIPNSECRDYVTEKFWMQSLKYGTVPVVIGAKKDSYERIAPPRSFIHAADFPSLEELAKYLEKLDKDDDEYRKYNEWRREGEVMTSFPTRPDSLCQTLPYLKTKRREKQFKYLSDSPWFNGCRLPVDRRMFDLTRTEETELFDFENWSIWR